MALLECCESGPVTAAREDRHCKSILPGGGSGECCTVRIQSAVIDEPGPLHGDLDDGALCPRPDELLTFITRGDGHAIARVCTDVSIVERNTRPAAERGPERM